MNSLTYTTVEPFVEGNAALREPQIESFKAIRSYFVGGGSNREVGVILPVGCGKSGLAAIVPFAVKAKRVLLVAPGLNIASQLMETLDPSGSSCFYQLRNVIEGDQPFPELAELRSETANQSDLEDADIVVTNIQQLQGVANKWLGGLVPDFFDLIIFDEGHHNVASTWENLRTKFPSAKIVNLSATPLRADGQMMQGEVIYSYPVARAMQLGFVKRLRAVVLNPTTLHYVRQKDGQEIEVSLDEVKRLGEEDAQFRRSIVSSAASLATIVDAAILQLRRLREDTNNQRHKIIASALNMEHCIQITAAFSAKGLRADYVHSRNDDRENARILKKLEADELDVIVQVRKLGEGFDHPHLSVAAVCSIFSNLSPFVQFVGRIMRAIDSGNPLSAQNQGVVVFHAGANIAQRWSDFKTFSQADQDYFDQLLPLEELNFGNEGALDITPDTERSLARSQVEVKRQKDVLVSEQDLIEQDDEALAAIEVLRRKGIKGEDVDIYLRPLPVRKQVERIALRKALDEYAKNMAMRVLTALNLSPAGRNLDARQNNFIVMKRELDRTINSKLGKESGQRAEVAREEFDEIIKSLDSIALDVLRRFQNGEGKEFRQRS